MSKPAVTFVVLVIGAVALGASTLVSAEVGAGPGWVPSEADGKGASEAVRAYLALSAHAMGSGGDPRFLERIPAAPELLEELSAAIAFAAHGGNVEEPRLMGLDVRSVEAIGVGRVLVETREFWVTRIISAEGAVLQTRSDVMVVRYVVAREGTVWQVERWTMAPGAGADRS